jgi:hypothetical protein
VRAALAGYIYVKAARWKLARRFAKDRTATSQTL